MMAATHRLGGSAVGMTMVALLPIETPEKIIIIGSSVLGSFLPDIDNRNSRISRKWQLISFVVTLGQAIIRGISSLLPGKWKKYIRSLIGHRGITHSLMAAILFPILALIIGHLLKLNDLGMLVAVGICGGVLSHLLFDMFAGGVPLLMPFSVKKITLASIKTGGLIEWIFRIVLIIVFVYLGWEEFSWQRLLRV